MNRGGRSHAQSSFCRITNGMTWVRSFRKVTQVPSNRLTPKKSAEELFNWPNLANSCVHRIGQRQQSPPWPSRLARRHGAVLPASSRRDVRAGQTADQIRAGHQPEDRERARPHHSAIDPRPSRGGDRVPVAPLPGRPCRLSALHGAHRAARQRCHRGLAGGKPPFWASPV
jgi:hypothetical protein